MPFTKHLPDGRRTALEPMLWDQARLCVAEPSTWLLGLWDEVYTYPSMASAMVALSQWPGEPDTEPEGWTRHQPSNRRRPGGDPAREYVRP